MVDLHPAVQKRLAERQGWIGETPHLADGADIVAFLDPAATEGTGSAAPSRKTAPSN